MNKQEAIQAMQEGKKVTHDYFSDDEFIYLKKGEIHDENDCNLDSEFWKYRSQEYWQNGWNLYKTDKL